uniref:Uncharacterized protein n=1 Tax=Bracon brevicornis TaxID=1563983 RepID=A0A6V7LT02_9HYME
MRLTWLFAIFVVLLTVSRSEAAAFGSIVDRIGNTLHQVGERIKDRMEIIFNGRSQVEAESGGAVVEGPGGNGTGKAVIRGPKLIRCPPHHIVVNGECVARRTL